MNIQKWTVQALAVLIVAGVVTACTEPATEGDEPPTQSESSRSRQETSGQSAIDRVLERGVLRVGTTGDWQPMTYLDPDTDEYQGYYVDIVRDLAADMDVEIEWVRTTWQDKVSGIAAGRYDLTTGASFNLGRARQGAFTEPIAVVGTVPLTLTRDADRYDSWESINQDGVRVAATLGTTQDEQAQRFFPNAELVRPDSGARDYQEVIAGRADVSITSNIEAGVLAERFENLEIIDVEPRATLPNGMIVDRGDVEWLNYVNAWITMKEYEGYFDQKAEEYGLSF
ncbi:MAG: transporter substrate-binding domain-containing protein [Alkalispirochaeta sp.]